MTLLELLVAVSILALLSVSFTSALTVAIRADRGVRARLSAEQAVRTRQELLRNALSNLFPANMICRAARGHGLISAPLFEGTPEELRFATSYSLRDGSRGAPRVVELAAMRDEDGSVRLVIQEQSWTALRSPALFCEGLETADGTMAARFAPVTPRPNAVTLAGRLASCRFTYQEPAAENGRRLWTSVWNFPNRWPTAVRIETDRTWPSLTIPIRAGGEP